MALSIVIATPEAAPFAKTGGLADVAGSLGTALAGLGCRVSLVMPYYRQVASYAHGIKPSGMEVSVAVGGRMVRGTVLKCRTRGVDVYFLGCDEFFDRAGLYGTPKGDYPDNLERFSFFSRGVLEVLKAAGIRTDVIHCNDWQSGLVAAYLKGPYLGDPFFSKTASLFTIHNVAYQGLFDARLFSLTGLSPEVYAPDGVEFWGRVSLLKAGIVYSDIITTVSRAYCREIQTPELGAGLEGVLRERGNDLFGVLNGVDYTEWDPETDALIPENYSAGDLSGKRVCREALLKEFGLRVESGSALIGVVSRLAGQKGLDIFAGAMPAIERLGAVVVVLGAGERRIESMLMRLAEAHAQTLSVKIAFDNALAHRVEAGCDMLLMPSRYEPCGLSQIYALRYGTIPVVRATGGLDDTIKDYCEDAARGNGFKFKDYTAEALAAKVADAVALHRDAAAWTRLVKKAMKQRFTWDGPARRYMELYALARKRRA